MAVTPISGAPSAYRHTGTGFIVHEVFNTEQVLEANGVLIDYLTTNRWIWLAGRDLRDFMAVRNISTLQDFVAKAAYDNSIMGTMHIVPADGGSAAAFPAFGHGSRVVTAAAGFPGTKTDTVYAEGRVFALINNLHAGRGKGGGGEWTKENLSWYPTDMTMAAFMDAFPATEYKNRWLNGLLVSYNNAYVRSSDRTSLRGTGVVTVPLGVTWEKFFSDVIASLDNSDKSEVREKCTATLAAVLPHIKKISPIPVCYVPIEIIAGGEFRVVTPKAASRAPTTYGTPAVEEIVHVLRGGVYFDETGLACTSDEWIHPTQVYSNMASTTSFTHWMADSLVKITGTLTSYTPTAVRELFSTPVNAIDGVRLERILGGVAGNVMPLGAEVDLPVGAVNMTSAELVTMWKNSLRFASTDSTFDRPLQETDEAYTTRLLALAPTAKTESPVKTRLSQWDNHGFTAAHGMMTFLAALDGEKTTGGWLTCLWPGRQILSMPLAARSAGSYQANGSKAFPAIPLVPLN